MSSVNSHPTFQYSQPEEYRFSHDSVFLARKVFEMHVQEDLSTFQGLDLCAGCGIIGLDFLFHCRQEGSSLPKIFDFIEVQDVYRPHFEKNVQSLGPLSTSLNFLKKNYADLSAEFQRKYDLILCNPPYFQPGQGKMSPSEFKNRCRFYLDSDFASLLRMIDFVLKPEGQAYLLLRDLSDHGWSSIQEAQKLLAGKRRILSLGDIRGTGLVRIDSGPAQG